MSEGFAETKGFVQGLFWGTFLGAVLMFLWGTPKGRKIKEEIREKGEEFFEDLPALLEEIEEKGEKLAQKVSEVRKEAEEIGSHFQEATSEEKETSAVEKLQETGRQAEEEIHKPRLFKGIAPRRH